MRLILAFILMLAAAAPAHAGRCAAQLAGAERSLDIGRFDAARRAVDECLGRHPSGRERAAAYELLARLHLAVDEHAEARAAVRLLLRINPDFEAGVDDPRELIAMVEAERWNDDVSSVSKIREGLREAPATVAVITRAQIRRRGYVHLEELLHDLPGFDISRGNGDVFSNIYQRGYRSDANDRMLFLVDGVEHNDVQSNIAYISRQYPLSNVQRVEVLYGPASTIYGADAFTGVVNVITREPHDIIRSGKNLGVEADAGVGSYATRWVDLTVAGRLPDSKFEWMVTARRLWSDEQDLSRYREWDHRFDDFDYVEELTVVGPPADALAELFFPDGVPAGPFEEDFGDFRFVRDADGLRAELTRPGEELVRAQERRLYDAIGQGRFSDRTDDWFVSGSAHVSDLRFGFQLWRREEGTEPWYFDYNRHGSGDNDWVPRQLVIFSEFERRLSASLSLAVSAHYQEHTIEPETSSASLRTYRSGFLDATSFRDVQPSLLRSELHGLSTRVHGGATLVWEPRPEVDVVGGLDLQFNLVQSALTIEGTELVTENGSIDPQASRGIRPRVRSRDVGLFVQGNYRPRPWLKLVAGIRMDDDKTRARQDFRIPELSLDANGDPVRDQLVRVQGFGTVFNPRLGAVVSRGDWVFKAIYAEAFEEPSSFQRFTTEPVIRVLVDPRLRPEKVRNLDLSASYEPRPGLSGELVAYRARYSDIVSATAFINPLFNPIFTTVFLNIGGLRVTGVQASGRLDWRRLELGGNYTYTRSRNTDPTDEIGQPLADVESVPTGDIASHQLNLTAQATLPYELSANLRFNWVGARQTGAGTSVPTNLLREIDPYLVSHLTLTWDGLGHGLAPQLTVNNLFNSRYDHPGVRTAGRVFASRLPQPGRAVYFRLRYDF